MPELAWEDNLLPADQTAMKPLAIQPGQQLTLPCRWRLILGSEPEKLPPMAARAAKALDELYGQGQGEGARRRSGQGAGQDPAYPGTREWAEDLGELFGENVREEVLGEALSAGRAGAFLLLESEPVTPSIELLEQVLSLKGSLPESQMEKLRRFVRRIVDQLVKELSTKLRPALAGLTTSRPTSRKTPRLDLKRTVRANLHTARANSQGRMQLVPERFLFKTLSKRSMDWHVIFVVDVSGSMEPSVIYSAMMAAIFSGLPAISVQFLAFSTQVIDFTDRVEDPLSMLMEVEVGGGTHIAKGLRAARERLRVPKRSIVLLVTDFEEGFPISGLLAEVRAIVDSGATALGLAALSDDGKPRYNKGIAGQVVNHGMPVAALSPMELARWVGEQIR
jgi:Mg-chelatase subunit ChlD